MEGSYDGTMFQKVENEEEEEEEEDGLPLKNSSKGGLSRARTYRHTYIEHGLHPDMHNHREYLMQEEACTKQAES